MENRIETFVDGFDDEDDTATQEPEAFQNLDIQHAELTSREPNHVGFI